MTRLLYGQIRLEMKDEFVTATLCWLEGNKVKECNHEVDYLPEYDRVRFAIQPNVHREALKSLLELNHETHEEEN